MKSIKTKSKISASNLKKADCDYKGYRLGYDKSQDLYFIGSHFNSKVDYFETIKLLKEVL